MSWTTTTLGDFSPLTYGKGLPRSARRSGEVKVFGSNGPVGTHDTALVNEPGVIVGRKGSVGEVHYSSDPFWPIDTSYYITAGENRCVHFTYYLLKHLGLQRLSGDSAVPGLNRDTAHRQEVYVPDLRTQKRIASTLGLLDNLIESNRRLIEILEEMARLLYREWFVHFRFPGHEDVELVDSDLGPIPEGWSVRSFSDLAEFVNGFAFKPYHWLNKGLPIIKIKELKGGVTAGTPRYHGADVDKKYFIENGAVLFSWSADLKAYVWAHGSALLNQHLFDVRPHEVSPLFIFHALNARMDHFQARAQGTTMKHIKRSALNEVRTSLPPVEVREEFETVVRPMLDLQLNLTAQNVTLREARDLLLPRLVSGELDVSELDLGLVVA